MEATPPQPRTTPPPHPRRSLEDLHHLLREHLQDDDMQAHIREVVDEILQSGGSDVMPTEDEILEGLRKKGVLDTLLQNMTGEAQDTPKVEQVDRSPRCVVLRVELKNGKAFLDHLVEEVPSTPELPRAYMTAHLHFRGQRFSSKPVPCVCDPVFSAKFEFTLNSKYLLSVSERIHLVIARRTSVNGREQSHLVASHWLEWRGVLLSAEGLHNFTVQLMGVGVESSVPVGLLGVSLRIVPASVQPVREEALQAQLRLERGRKSERERLFLVYAKRWWADFLDEHPAHSSRLVKIFGTDESGQSRPICSFARKLNPGRTLYTHLDALRMVSLMPTLNWQIPSNMTGRTSEKSRDNHWTNQHSAEAMHQSYVERWTNQHVLLVLKRGSIPDKANLLCGLLQGFGMDAYVCIGTLARHLDTPYFWVVALNESKKPSFFDAVSGRRMPLAMMATVGCTYNGHSLFANRQPSDAVSCCKWNFYNHADWTALPEMSIRSVLLPPVPPLVGSTLNPESVAVGMEKEIMQMIARRRAEVMGLDTHWCSDMQHLLGPVLRSFELEVCGDLLAESRDEVMDALVRSVPDGFQFRGCPMQVCTLEPINAFVQLMQDSVCQGVIHCRGDPLVMALRVTIHPFPEVVNSVWVMVACKFKPGV